MGIIISKKALLKPSVTIQPVITPFAQRKPEVPSSYKGPIFAGLKFTKVEQNQGKIEEVDETSEKTGKEVKQPTVEDDD